VLTAEQVRRIAREGGLSAGVVEKDYAITWLLRGYYQRDSWLRRSLVLKGGTAIRKVYFPSTWRFSEDLDFTVVRAERAERMRESMLSTFESLLRDSGVSYTLGSFHVAEGSVMANVRFVGPLDFANVIRHDITLKERMVLEPVWMPIASHYPDLHEFEVLAYPLVEILVEKIRSIMQRGYSRDYYDVWRMLKESGNAGSMTESILMQKCELNDVEYEPSLIFDERRLAEARSYWIKGLGHLTKELPEFDTVISELKGKLGFSHENDS